MIKETIKSLQYSIGILESQILKLAGWNPGGQRWSVVGTWDCPKSLCGLCCYDHYKDSLHDQCVFCGEPSERK